MILDDNMSRVRAKNPLVVKIFIIVFVCIVSLILAYYVMKIIISSNSLSYDLGETVTTLDYKDVVLTNYSEYEKLMKKYGVQKDLAANNFSTNYYLASFQDYDTCSETKMKTVKSATVGDDIKIVYEIHNKCGWCKKHIALFLIKIDKYPYSESKKVITYDYEYENELDCGTVK